jgi:replicative DNA helicase
MEDLHGNSHNGIDLVVLVDYLQKQDKLEGVGGQAYLIALLESIPTAGHIKHHAKLVKEKATLRTMAALGNGLFQAAFQDRQDTGELIQETERRFYELALSGKGYDASRDVICPKNMAKLAFDRVVASHEQPQEIRGIQVGFGCLDKETGGLRDLTFISGTSGVGKTGVALNWAKNIGIDDKIPCLYLNYEMAEEELIARLLGIMSGVPVNQIKSGNYTQPDSYGKLISVMNDLHTSQLFITDNEPKDINTTISLIYQHKIQHGIKVVFIDYLGEIMPDEQAGKESEYMTYGRWTQMLKGICVKLDIRLVMIAQLNREGETAPRRDKVAGSWKLVQKADVFCILYIYKGLNYVMKVAKQRHGTYPLFFELDYQKNIQRVEEVGYWNANTNGD